jgi:hypothetical protein
MQMFFDSDIAIRDLVHRFEERTIPKRKWNHAAHLVIGLYYCYNYPIGAAKNLMSDGIYWLNDKHGTPNTEESGYHETLTVFWLRCIARFLFENREYDSLSSVANKLIRDYGNPNLPLTVYSRERLFSAGARLGYVEPDLNIGTKNKISTLLPLQHPA